MDFALTDDHLALRDAVRRFCDGEYPAHERGNVEGDERAAQRCRGLAELGLFGLLVPEEFGGSAQGPVEAMLAAQELGRACAAGPWLASAVVAAPLIAQAGTPEQCTRWLPAIARGSLRPVLVAEGARARRDGSRWRIDGRQLLAVGGDRAALLLVPARSDDGVSLFSFDSATPGVTLRPFTMIDNRGAAHVDLDGVIAGDERLVGPLHGAEPALAAANARAAAMLCADSAGALDALLEMTVEHLRTRRQFGAPLAKFQALQHQVADLAIALEQLKSMACVAALALESADARERDRLVSAAKTLAAQLGRRCGLAAIQLHGAMGMTDECRVGHAAKRLIANGLLYGDAPFHLRRFAETTTTGDTR